MHRPGNVAGGVLLCTSSGLGQVMAAVKNHAALRALQQRLQFGNRNQEGVHGHFFRR